MKTKIEVTYNNKKGFNEAIRGLLEHKKCNETDSCNFLFHGQDWKLEAHNSPEDFKTREKEINQEFDSAIQIQHGERLASLEREVEIIKDAIIEMKTKLPDDFVMDEIEEEEYGT